MTKPKRPAHTGLDRHNRNLAEATSALREAETTEAQAASAVETARDAVREAHDLGADPAEPTAQLDQAKQNAEAATLAREGIEQRVNRATHERENYLAENGRELLAELQPDCQQAVDDLRLHAEALLAADKQWRALSAVVGSHLRAQRLVPHMNAPGEHGLESVVLDLKRALQNQITSPAPHMSAQRAAHTEQARVTNLRREREAVA
jgi:hypothetical protein